MSRSNNSRKGSRMGKIMRGKESWSKRFTNGLGISLGPGLKNLTHRKERRDAKAIPKQGEET